MGNITITPVAENTAPTGMGLMAEHGLSFHILNNGEELLFDTGQGLVLENNMKLLGKEISKIQKIVLSHGHYDHTGGLKFASENADFSVFGHPDLFIPKFASIDGENFYDIGCPVSRVDLEENGVSFLLSKSSQKVSDNIITTGEIPLRTDFEIIENHFYREGQNKKIPDPLNDDLGIIIETDKGLVVILGCTHRGIINTLMHISDLTGEKKFHMVMGGLHLGGADKVKMDLVIDKLSDFKIDNLITAHCTGSFASVCLASSEKINHSFIGLGFPYSF